MKKRIQVLVIGMVILILCFIIGQKIVLPLRGQDNSTKDLANVEISISDRVDVLKQFDYLEQYGYKETDDNPWKKTVVLVNEDREIPEGILITPGTGVGVPLRLGDNVTLEIGINIHPWVAEHSDGALLQIEYTPENGEEDSFMKEYEIQGQETDNITVNLSEFSGTKGILKITCQTGKSGDDSGDWLYMTKIDVLNAELRLEKNKEKKTSFLKSVHYFADEWPINFWSCELTNIDNDFEQIRKDGFNSIILAIPWREFQPTLEPVSYNEVVLSKLESIMQKAEQYDLTVMIRVGYIWDYYEDTQSEVVQRYYDVVGNQEVRQAWYDYCGVLYDCLSKYSNFEGGFITWEDFWNNVYLVDALQTSRDRQVWAEKTGFQEWLRSKYTIKALREKYRINVSDYSDIEIPVREDSMMELWYEYIDTFFMQLLEESQKYFPNLSMEVRTDWDIYNNAEGEAVYYKHNKTYACANSLYTSVMYGIPQGCLNQGERLHYDEAIQKTEYILNSISEENQNKPIYIDQFLFADNTPGFEKNAQIYEDEVNNYLINVGEVLQKYTMGYAVWAYKDYASNLLYNPQFGEKLAGWITEEGEAVQADGNKQLLLYADGKIYQKIPPLRVQYPNSEYTVSMDVSVAEETNLSITVGNKSMNVTVNESGPIEVKITVESVDKFEINTDKDITIDNVKVYNHIQNGFLYDLKGNEQGALAGMRSLNESVMGN